MENITNIINQEWPKSVITRVELAKWYGITERGLRKRIGKTDICINNRVLTINDILTIISKIGIPPMMPREWISLLDVKSSI